MVTTIVFDFNGTMFFDENIQRASWGQFIKQNFKRRLTDEEFEHHIAGRNNRDTLEYYCGRSLTDHELTMMTDEKEAIYCKLCLSNPSEFKLVSGLPEFLDECVNKGIALNIATASERPNLEFFFKHLNLDRWFEIENAAFNDFTLPGKPAPDMFLKAIGNVHSKPNECAIFEDSVSGIQAANNAKVNTVILVIDPDGKEIDFPNSLRIDSKISNYWNMSETLTKHK